MKKILVIVISLLSLTMMEAQEGLVLSLDEAQEYAVKQNRSMQNASLEVQRAHAQRWQTIAAMLPQADAAFGRTMMYDSTWNEKTISLGMPGVKPMSMSPYQFTATASIGINGQAIVGALLQSLAIEMQDITRKQTETDLRGKVMTSYMSVLVMEDVIDLLDSTLANMQKLANQTKEMVAVGAAESTQYDQMLVRVNAMKNNVSSNKRNVELAYNALRVLLGVEADTELSLTTTIDDVATGDRVLNLLSETFNIHNNYNYQLLEKNVDMAKKNIHMAGWAYGPTLSGFYRYTGQYGKDVFTMMSSPHTLGFSVSMPIWSSGQRASGVHDKRIALHEAENTLAETTDNLSIQDKQLRYNMTNAYEIFLNEKENIEVSARVMSNVMNKYTWGAASLLELTNASNDVITAQQSYVQATLTLVNAYVELEKFLHNEK